MVRLVFLLLLTLLFVPQLVFAQAPVTVRTGEHSGYTRAVFDWGYSVPFDIQETEPGKILVSFHAAADMELEGGGHGSGTEILGIRQLSSDGTNLQVMLDTPPGMKFRHFTVGNKVVVDILDPSPQPVVKQPPAPVAAKTPEAKPVVEAKAQAEPVIEAKAAAKAKAEEAKQADKVEVEAKGTKEDDTPQMPAVKPDPVEVTSFDQLIEAKDAIEPSIIEQSVPPLEPHVITVSATEEIGLSAFRRNGWLWVVIDRPSMTVPPLLAGEQADKFGKFERIELKDGIAYRMKLPAGAQGMYLYGEGGGLVWRLVLTPNKRDVKAIGPKRSFNTMKLVRGGVMTFPFFAMTKIIDVSDPSVGDVLKVVTVEQADQFSGPKRRMVDFNVLESIVGLAVKPNIDDIEISIGSSGVKVTRPSGLAVSRLKDVNRRIMREEVQNANVSDQNTEVTGGMRRIFDFDRWMMGGLQALEENQRILLSGMAVKDKNGRVQDLLTLAKMNVSNDRGQEAIGYLDYAAAELPDIADSPEFRALRGASAALAGKPTLAFRELFHPTLVEYGELDYWRAYTLAALEDWQQAVEAMPDDLTVLIGYPLPLLEKVGVKLAEIKLRAGDVGTAEGILAVLQRDRGALWPWTKAALDYLKGEAHRQSGEYDMARQWWEPLVVGHDDLHRAKAGLALTMIEIENGDLSSDESLDRLEGLRYAWRGDELEARINFLTGRLYIEQDRYLKGFSILRDATTMSVDSDIGKEITAYMQEAFKDLLLNDDDLTPLEAVEVYEEFRELTPSGDEGNRLVQKLAERLTQADLLDRASAILEHQVEFRLQAEEKARVAVRLGAILLLDRNARKAMKYLALGRDMYAKLLQGDDKAKKLQEIDLLRARGLSQLNRTEEAIEMLNSFPPNPDINRLRADIAWQSGLWEDAAEALQDLVLDESLDANRPLTPYQADLILNRAVSLNLSGNRVALNNMRRRFEDQMKKTPRARLFDIVTRPRKTSILADRETIESIVQEVDLFEEFLQSYKTDAEAFSN